MKRFLFGISLLAILIALWPNADSLYDLTGEEALDGQLVGILHWLNTAVRPQPQLAPDAVTQLTVGPQTINPLGMNTFLQEEVEPAKRERILQLIQEMGFGVIRQEFVWEDIEIHGKGDFEDRRNIEAVGIVDAWAKYDNIVDLADQYEIEILARLSNPPSWSRALPDEVIGAKAPPDDFNDYGDFVAAVAERYKGRIRFYQLWNEPNGNEEWGLQNVDPEAFTALLCVGYARIKAIDPEAVVLAGALTPTLAMNGRNMNDLIFLERMYEAGAADCFDVMSAQGYGLWSGPTDQRLRPTVINYPHHMFIRDIMVRQGDGHKPIWISEMGWNTAPAEIAPTFGRVTAEQQAHYGVGAYERAQAEWPWLQVLNYWFFKRPADWEKSQAMYYFRVMEPDFTPLPVFTALSDYGNSEQLVAMQPNWVYGWHRLRPFFFLLGSTLLFFLSLTGLAGKEIES